MWVFYDGLWLILSPRYFAFFTVARIVPCIVYSCITGFFLVLTLSTSHLSGLNCIIRVSSHFCRLSRSVWRARQTSLFRTFLYNRQSSAKSLAFNVTSPGKSLIYMRKCRGPMAVPWGTPDVTGDISDFSPSTPPAAFVLAGSC